MREFFRPGVTKAVLTRVNSLETEAVDGVTAVDGALELLPTLSANQWAAITSGSRPLMAARLQTAGLPVPQVLITADDVRFGKPHPEGFVSAARALGVSPASCIVVEDSPQEWPQARQPVPWWFH